MIGTILIMLGVFWAIGAFVGCIVYFDQGSEDSADYARAIFWPLVFFIFICKGLAKLFEEA